MKLTTKIKITWQIDDVKAVREDLTDEECSAVLISLKENHDATIGINWDVIEATCETLYPNF